MLRRFTSTITLVFITMVFGGCQLATVEGDFDAVPIEVLLSDAPSFDGRSVCSAGFVKVGEGIYVYSSIDDLIHKTYDRVIALNFTNTKRPDYSELRFNQKVQFCGVIEVDEDCWMETSKSRGPNCIPYSKPVDVNVHKFNY
ncbi:MAG: hypothetical protein COA60_006255 [Robiginitomaculum sp.]|nr:hypothetical protein [Robiginitomaculum sp.]